MRLPPPEVDYRGFRLSWLRQKQYRHLLWLLFWPIYWLRYPLIEQRIPAAGFTEIHCPLDDRIPFLEWFILPYMLWMVSMVALCLYTVFYDVKAFRQYHKFLVISMSISTVIILLFPSCQNLRPETLPRDNLLSWCVKILYAADTNTNVMPSEHVIGAVAVWLGAYRTKSLRKPGRFFLISIFSILVCLSTLFLKQHSVLDMLAALPICALAAWLTREKPDKRI